MRLSAIALATAVLASPIQAAGDGPAFGLTARQSAATIRIESAIEGQRFYILPPNPNPEFETYIANISPRMGLCRVSGLGKSYYGDRTGTRVLARYLALRDTLTRRYGTPALTETALPRIGQSTVARDLDSKRLELEARWSAAGGNTMPAGMASITLSANAVNDTTTYLMVSYNGPDLSTCSRSASSDEQGL